MTIDYNLATPQWHDSHLYGPAPRWRRRVLRRIVKKLDIKTCLEAGCAQPFLMLDLKKTGIQMAGCDISAPVIDDNAKTYPDMDFFVADLCADSENFLAKEGFDIVICSEVVEHLPDYLSAIRNLCKLSKKYVLITTQSGKLYPRDASIGHIRHFELEMLTKPLENNGFKIVKAKKIGFPFYSIYRNSVKHISENSATHKKYLYSKYSNTQKLICNFVYFLFGFNIFPFGSQLIILAERQPTGESL